MTAGECGNDVGVCGNGGGCVRCVFVGAAALWGGLRLGGEISPVYVIPAKAGISPPRPRRNPRR